MQPFRSVSDIKCLSMIFREYEHGKYFGFRLHLQIGFKCLWTYDVKIHYNGDQREYFR